MTNANFIKFATSEVNKYVLNHIDKSDDTPDFDTFVVWSCKTLQNHKCLISTTLHDGMYYECTYNGDKNEMYLDAYKKFENKKNYLRKRGIIMSNSKLVNYTKLSPNHSGKRTHSIDRITPHCVVGQCSVETLGNIFQNTACEASCNYGIGYDGRVLLCVDEGNRSWCSSSNANDQRAVTIECASDTVAPYTMNSKVYNKLVALCVDICKRNGKTKLLWFGNEDKTLNYSPKSGEMVLTVHRWFANKSSRATGSITGLAILQTK